MFVLQSKDEDAIPLSVSCWPSVSGGESDVTVEYESLIHFDIQNAVIAIPCHQPPRIKQVRMHSACPMGDYRMTLYSIQHAAIHSQIYGRHCSSQWAHCSRCVRSEALKDLSTMAYCALPALRPVLVPCGQALLCALAKSMSGHRWMVTTTMTHGGRRCCGPSNSSMTATAPDPWSLSSPAQSTLTPSSPWTSPSPRSTPSWMPTLLG